MYEYSVTIGRNVGNEPMAESDWQTMQASARNLLARACNRAVCHADALETSHGVGVWDGIREDNARVVMRTTAPLDHYALTWLRWELTDLARAYAQDAIALTVGTSELIDAR